MIPSRVVARLVVLLAFPACADSSAPAPCADLSAPPSVGTGQIAFASDCAGQFDVFLMNANGTGVQRLTEHLGFDFWPSWSPDGSRIAFTSDRDSHNGVVNLEIYVMNADGTGVAR